MTTASSGRSFFLLCVSFLALLASYVDGSIGKAVDHFKPGPNSRNGSLFRFLNPIEQRSKVSERRRGLFSMRQKPKEAHDSSKKEEGKEDEKKTQGGDSTIKKDGKEGKEKKDDKGTTDSSKPTEPPTTPQKATQDPARNVTYMVMRPPLMQQQQPMPQQPANQRPTAALILTSHAAVLITQLVRLWLFTHLGRWFGQVKTMRPKQSYIWENLNERYSRDEEVLAFAVQAPPSNMSSGRWRRISRRRRGKKPRPPKGALDNLYKRTVLVLDVKNSNLSRLERIVTFILTQHRQHNFGTSKESGLQQELEVVLLVESPGGGVDDFGLAASQVSRLSKEEGILATVCVDKLAASGGYMIASQANRLCAAPFAAVGSVGVIRQDVNWHDFLQRYGIQPFVLKAGDSKVPITKLGEVKKSDIKQVQENMDKVHSSFQQLVVEGRPALSESLEIVGNGELFLGTEAKNLMMVDRVVTSEEYLLERILDGDRVLKLHPYHQQSFLPKPLSPSQFPFLSEKGAGKLSGFVFAMRDFFSSEAGAGALSAAVQATSVLGFVRHVLQNK